MVTQKPRKRRTGWAKLSPAYKRRIERGIGRTAWQRGDSLKKVRGHSVTPEHRDNLAIVSSYFALEELFPDFFSYTLTEQRKIATKFHSWFGSLHTNGTTDKQRNDIEELKHIYYEHTGGSEKEYWLDARNAYNARFSVAA